MHYIHRSETDPFFNIAAEEYFLKQYDKDIIMLWANELSVIIGWIKVIMLPRSSALVTSFY